MNTVSIQKMHLQERHAQFWEFLWTIMGAAFLGLLFLLLHLRLTG
jgi:hypothetical protein